jgi:hypothetical protein
MELANKGIALERTSNDSKNAIGPRNKNNKKPKILTVHPPVSPLGEDDMSFSSFSDESCNRKHPHNGTLEDVDECIVSYLNWIVLKHCCCFVQKICVSSYP